MSPVVTTSNSLVGKEGVGAPSELLCKTLYTWEEVVLLHLAMEWEGLVVKDSSVLETLDRLELARRKEESSTRYTFDKLEDVYGCMIDVHQWLPQGTNLVNCITNMHEVCYE
ncbi:hypothetical protein JHK86_017920 [Glycine max]|nr:hypothetical protein JHK86_017920 [Glycine max]